MAASLDLQFMTKIRNRLGYLIVQDGAIYKSEGDLANNERISQLAQKIVAVGGPNSLAGEKFSEIIVNYTNYYYSVRLMEDGLSILVVKRRKSNDNEGVHSLD